MQWRYYFYYVEALKTLQTKTYYMHACIVSDHGLCFSFSPLFLIFANAEM